MGKNYLNKILIFFIIIFNLFSFSTHAKESYSSLFIKITDANSALIKNDKDSAKNLIMEFEKEFNSLKNSNSEAGKKVKETIDFNDLTEENLTKLSSALLEFEKEQNPIDIDSEKVIFKNKVFPALEKLEKAIDTKNVEIMKDEYVKYNSTWVRNESLVRSTEPGYYGKIETAMFFLRSSMEIEPFNYDNTKSSFTDVKVALEDFLAGKKIEQNNDITTLDQGINLLKESYSAFKENNFSVGSQKMKKFIQVWPVIEGEVRTRNSSLYTKIESETPIIMVKGSEEKYQNQLNSLISELEKIDTKSNYTFFDAMLILLREGIEALIIVLSLASAVKAAKQKKGLKWIYSGAICGIFASILTAFILQTAFPTLSSGTNREIIEGIVGIIAVIMMIGIGIWLHSKSSTKAWQKYLDKKLNTVLSTGSFVSMFSLSFLAVFREGAETILFYVGILPLITLKSLIIGIILAIVLLIIIGFIMTRATKLLSVSKVFFALSLLIYVLAFKMLGVSIHALQITNILPTHILNNIPTIELLGIYPSVESIISQVFFIFIIISTSYFQKKDK